MYLFLLVFGAFLSLAGVVLAASGLSVHDRSFDPTLFTPGIVAVAGGLLLIGLGLALRVLQRIESALAVRPVTPRTARAGEAAEPAEPVLATAATAATVTPELPAEPSRIPFPVKIARLPQTAPVGGPIAAPAPLIPAAERRPEELRQKFAKVARATNAPAIEEIELTPRSLAPAPFNGAEENIEQNVGPFVPRAARARNGVAPAPRISTRLDTAARAQLTTERPKGPAFDALWPKGPRPLRAGAQAAQTQASAMPAAAPEPVIEEPAPDPSPIAAPDEAAEPVTILKSGIVDGMAYTLYSDGSIEAQLPQGMLRFGSISELRAHIEQDSQS
jgi:hypothetical protein